MTKIKDVALAAGVSTATVSRVIANKPHVREEIRQRVLAVVDQLGYRPNLVARNLREQKSKIIGLIVSDIQNPFFRYISRSVEDVAHKNGFSVILCNNDEDPLKEKMYLQLMQDQNIAGIILSPTRQAVSKFETILKLNIPMVVIDRRIHNVEVDNICIDNVSSSFKVTQHLVEKGYQRIGGIFGKDSITGQERYEGYLNALKDSGMKSHSELVKFVAPREETGYQATLKLLQLANKPDALFTSNSLLAAGALRAIQEKKLAIPEQIALTTFDDTSWARLVTPPLTVIDQPAYEIGQTATELLMQRIDDPSRSTREITLNGKLIIRQSSTFHS
ncbi:MAG: LacI family DNA-binding transcriptional regulator [Deltaproteobacteria bacterium]|jgi:LacI family transcriptional regulator, fructose operon transcriptional repressor|nr:LacI family DNA-binding transcriptional regulator [Deltaproteobacteria bacterium]